MAACPHEKRKRESRKRAQKRELTNPGEIKDAGDALGGDRNKREDAREKCGKRGLSL